MKLSINSKVKDILANEKAKEILAKNGIDPKAPQLKMALGMTLKTMVSFPGHEMPKEVLEGLTKDLEEADIEV